MTSRSILHKAIESFPWLRHLSRYIPSMLLPGHETFLDTMKHLFRSEGLSEAELEEEQFQRFQELVRYSWCNIEGYRQLWKAGGFEPEALKKKEDIRRIPFLTKEKLQSDSKLFTNPRITASRYVSTGGSTGIPLGVLRDYCNDFVELAFTLLVWSWQFNGINRKSRSTILRGIRLDGLYKLDIWNNLWLSSYDIDSTNTKLYLGLMDKHRTEFLQAYPSALYQIARIMRHEGLSLNHRYQFICLASEPLYSFQRDLIEEVFQARICTHYGSTERVVLAANCLRDRRYHVLPQYGFTEIVDSEGNHVRDGESGEIVGTGFWNKSMPLIRYRTMDYAKLGPKSCSHCGRNYQILESIEGRAQEFIVTRSGKLISMTSINMHDDIFEDLKQFRFQQEREGEAIFQYVRKDKVEKINHEKIRKGIEFKLGLEINLTILEVKHIPLTKSGKLRFLDQKLDMTKYLQIPVDNREDI